MADQTKEMRILWITNNLWFISDVPYTFDGTEREYYDVYIALFYWFSTRGAVSPFLTCHHKWLPDQM